MAEIWGLALVAGATVVSGAMAADAAGDASDAANAGQQSGIAEQRAAREQFQQNINPYLEFGQGQLSQLNALNGGNYSQVFKSPDYLAALEMGTQQLDRGATAGGNLWGGGADADRIKFGQNLAIGQLGNYRNALQFGATLGQNSAVGAGQLGQQSANNISGAYGQMGQNSGNAAIGQANAWGNVAGQLGGLYGQYQGQQQNPSSYAQQTGNYGAFNPNQGGYSALGPSNGQNWNFG